MKARADRSRLPLTAERLTRRSRDRIVGLAVVLLLAGSGTLSWLALQRFEAKIVPGLEEKAHTVGESINTAILKAVGYGVPFARLRGMPEFLGAILAENPDLKYLAVADGGGEVLYHAGRDVTPCRDLFRRDGLAGQAPRLSVPTADCIDNLVPIRAGGLALGALHVGVDRRFITDKTDEVLSDILTVLVVSLLVTMELLLFLIAFTVTGPFESLQRLLARAGGRDFSHILGQPPRDEIGRVSTQVDRIILQISTLFRDAERGAAASARALEGSFVLRAPEGLARLLQRLLVYVRPPLFLIIFAEALSLSFFPVFVRDLTAGMTALSPEVLMGLPISVFMLSWALTIPVAGAWSDRVGRGTPLLVGAALTSVGLGLTALAHDLWTLLAVRALTAVGYGIVYITCQGYVTDKTTAANRTRGMSMFLACFFSGSLSGAAIGGILAEQIGTRPTFLVGAFLAALALLFSWFFMRDGEERRAAPRGRFSLAYLKTLLTSWRFLALTFLSAVPAKICLTGFLYYAAPLTLSHLGVSKSTSGRILMTYGVAMVLLTPLSGTLADRVRRPAIFVITGGVLSGLALLVPWAQPGIGAMLAGIVLLGIAHAIGVSSQLTLVTDIFRGREDVIGPAAAIGGLRLVERVGNILGPMIAGVLLSVTSFGGAIAGIGLIAVAGAVLLAVILAATGRKGRP